MRRNKVAHGGTRHCIFLLIKHMRHCSLGQLTDTNRDLALHAIQLLFYKCKHRFVTKHMFIKQQNTYVMQSRSSNNDLDSCLLFREWKHPTLARGGCLFQKCDHATILDRQHATAHIINIENLTSWSTFHTS
jgi:hypothetical protein